MSLSLYRALALAFMALIGLNACSLTGVRSPADAAVKTLDWQQRQVYLSKSRHWDVSGRIAMQTTDDAWSASMRWQQTDNDYDIQLFGPLGGNVLSITGGENYVFLTTDKGETFSERSATRLIHRQTGWDIPVDGLRYWSRALLLPEVPAKQIFDHVGRLSELRQSDWTIYYEDYRLVNDLEMPRKIRLVSAHFTVKLILRDWQLSPKRPHDI